MARAGRRRQHVRLLPQSEHPSPLPAQCELQRDHGPPGHRWDQRLARSQQSLGPDFMPIPWTGSRDGEASVPAMTSTLATTAQASWSPASCCSGHRRRPIRHTWPSNLASIDLVDVVPDRPSGGRGGSADAL